MERDGEGTDPTAGPADCFLGGVGRAAAGGSPAGSACRVPAESPGLPGGRDEKKPSGTRENVVLPHTGSGPRCRGEKPFAVSAEGGGSASHTRQAAARGTVLET